MGLFRQFNEDADPPRPPARRPLAEASGLAAAGELFPPGATISLIFLIAHLWLDEPERVAIADLAALISESTRAIHPEMRHRTGLMIADAVRYMSVHSWKQPDSHGHNGTS